MKHQERIKGNMLEKLIQLDKELAAERGHHRFKVSEPQGVAPEPLGSMVRKFCTDWLAERPAGYGSEFMGPVQWLAEKTEINVRQISGIANGEFNFISLSKADAILTAIGFQGWLDDEIPVIPNPQWSMEAYMDYMKERGCV